MMVSSTYLKKKHQKSRTAKMWLDCLVKPALIMMLFIRAEREGEWPLHLAALKAMMPYFFAAGHINYARYGLYYLLLRQMETLPENVLSHFEAGEHVMRHQAGLWNGIWSDMFIETTFMRYGHGPGGLVGITLNNECVTRWALSLHTCSRLLLDIKTMRETDGAATVTRHKEEHGARIAADNDDRQKLRQKIEMSIHPLQADEHPEGLVNIVSGKIITNVVNVDNALKLGQQQMVSFECSWPEGFNASITNKVITMKNNKKTVHFGDNIIVYDTQLIYSRVIGLMQSRSLDLKDIMSHELSPVPTSMFDDNGDMNAATTKSALKKKLQNTELTRSATKPDIVVIDGCALLWVIHWPTTGTLQTICNGVWTYIERLICTSDVFLVFDRCRQFSIKSSTRTRRADQQARTHKLTPVTPLPKQSVVLTNTDNKVQLIDILCEDLQRRAISHPELKHKLIITGSSNIPIEINASQHVLRYDIQTSHEEADVIIAQQAIRAAADSTKTVKVICDDTDVFVLLLHFYSHLKLSAKVIMEGTSGEHVQVDIGTTAKRHHSIIPYLMAAHALTGCDTVARMNGIGKVTAINQLNKGAIITLLGDIESNIDDVVLEATTFIAKCYGKEGENMSDVRFAVWKSKVGSKTVRKMPKLHSLLPTTEAFTENVKRAHFQACIWKSALQPDPPNFDVERFGWKKDKGTKTLSPITIPDWKGPAPPCVMKLISCSCTSESPCATHRCGCNSANLSCTIFCKCNESSNCENRCTKEAIVANSDDSDSESDSDAY